MFSSASLKGCWTVMETGTEAPDPPAVTLHKGGSTRRTCSSDNCSASYSWPQSQSREPGWTSLTFRADMRTLSTQRRGSLRGGPLMAQVGHGNMGQRVKAVVPVTTGHRRRVTETTNNKVRRQETEDRKVTEVNQRIIYISSLHRFVR